MSESSTRSRTSSGRIFCAGARRSSSKSRTTPRMYPGIRIQPIGVSSRRISSRRGSLCRIAQPKMARCASCRAHTLWRKYHIGTHSVRTTFSAAARKSWSMSMSSQADTLVLKAGEMSLHHVRLIHGSEPNPSDAAPNRFRDPLSAHLCPPGRRLPRLGHPGARRRPLRQLRAGAAAGRGYVRSGSGVPCGGGRRAREDPDAGYRAADAGVMAGQREGDACRGPGPAGGDIEAMPAPRHGPPMRRRTLDFEDQAVTPEGAGCLHSRQRMKLTVGGFVQSCLLAPVKANRDVGRTDHAVMADAGVNLRHATNPASQSRTHGGSVCQPHA